MVLRVPFKYATVLAPAVADTLFGCLFGACFGVALRQTAPNKRQGPTGSQLGGQNLVNCSSAGSSLAASQLAPLYGSLIGSD